MPEQTGGTFAPYQAEAGDAILLVGFVLTFVTIAIAWIAVRPLLGISLLVLAAGGLFWLISANRKKKRVQQQVQPSATQAA